MILEFVEILINNLNLCQLRNFEQAPPKLSIQPTDLHNKSLSSNCIHYSKFNTAASIKTLNNENIFNLGGPHTVQHKATPQNLNLLITQTTYIFVTNVPLACIKFDTNQFIHHFQLNVHKE